MARPTLFLLALASCQDAPPGTAPALSGSTPTISSSAPALAASDPYPRATDDDARPVYPQTHDPPDPRAEKYCDLIHEAGERKRKECCPSSPISSVGPTAECVRTLSSALRSGATTFAEGGLEACEAAVLLEAKQCDWGGEMPGACQGIFRGQLKEKQTCRSSLECEPAQFCRGLGVSTPGVCSPPNPEGARCAISPDSLASFVHQETSREHPVCQGVCFRGRCAAQVSDGGECVTALQCGPEQVCRGGHCGKDAPPQVGRACPASGCGTGHRCSAGACVVERRIGEDCALDSDCRSGACDSGKCAMPCTIRLAPAHSAGAKPPTKR